MPNSIQTTISGSQRAQLASPTPPLFAFTLEKRHVAFVVLLLGTASISLAPIMVAISAVGPAATGFWRLFLAAPLLWAGLLVAGGPRPLQAVSRTDLLALAVAGLCFAGMLVFWHYGIIYSSVANATLFQNYAPIFVTFAAWAFFSQRFRPQFVFAVACAVIGGMALVLDSLTVSRSKALGDFLGLVAALFYSGYLLAIGRLRQRLSTMVTMGSVCLFAAAVLFPTAAALDEAVLATDAEGWLKLLLLALVGQICGQGLIALSLGTFSPAFTSVVLLLEPVFAALLAWALLAQAIGPLQALGGAMILAGIVLAGRSRPEVQPGDGHRTRGGKARETAAA